MKMLEKISKIIVIINVLIPFPGQRRIPAVYHRYGRLQQSNRHR
jgi:Zn-dependent membrane protease YugP